MYSVELYTTPICPYCIAAKELLQTKGVAFKEFNVMGDPNRRQEMIAGAGGRMTVPQIFIGETHVGGCDDLYELEHDGKLDSATGPAKTMTALGPGQALRNLFVLALIGDALRTYAPRPTSRPPSKMIQARAPRPTCRRLCPDPRK